LTVITAAIYSVPVSPKAASVPDDLTAIVSEIAERLCEMEELKLKSTNLLIQNLARLAAVDFEAYLVTIEVLHGDTSCLLDSYAAQAGNDGRKKQTHHYRRLSALSRAAIVFPEVAGLLNQVRASAMLHNDPLSTADVLRESMERDDDNANGQ
jgi:hypothetical protein